MIQRRHDRLRSSLLVSLVAIGIVSSVSGLAQELPGPKKDREPLYFRRVYVPVGDLDDLIKGTMPLKRDSFVEMVEAINRSARDTLKSSEVRIVSSTYSGRLVDEGLVDGIALLDIEKKTGAPAMLPLFPGALAWGRPAWDGDPERPAVVGMDATGRGFVYVEKTGRLRIPWSLKGTSVVGQQKIFDFRIPASAASRLELRLPEKTSLASQNGLVLVAPLVDKAAEESKERDQDSLASTWIVELGGHHQTLLTVSPQENFQPRDPLILFRQTANYELTRTGMNLEVDLHVDVHHQPIRQLKLLIAPGLQLLTAQLGKQKLRWTTQDVAKGEQVTLHFTEPLGGADRVISLKTVASLVVGKDWTLPGIRVLEGVWQEEQANVSLGSDLTLVKLQSNGCHETGVKPGVSSAFEESRLFQFYQPQASISVVVEGREAEIHLDIGTRIDLASERMGGLVIADARAAHGQQFVLQGRLGTGWIVDAVETDPPEFLDDYEVIRVARPPRSGQARNQQRLVVRLNRAIQNGQDVRVLVRGHSRANQGKIDGSRLRMVDFESTASRRSVIAVGLEAGFQLRLTEGFQLQRLDPGEVKESLATSLDLDSTSLLLLDKPGLKSLRLQAYREQSRYSSEIHVQALFGNQRLEEQYQITCTPENAPLQQLLVHFYRPRGLPMQWTLPGDGTVKLVSRKLDQEEQELRGLTGGETWEVSLDQAQLDAFRLVGVRNVATENSATICLAAMPESITQVGSVSVFVPDSTDLDIQHGALERIPVIPGTVSRSIQVRGVYEYDPSENVEVKVARRQASGSQSALWAWSCQLQSRFTASGYSTHQAVYRLENKGVQHFDFRLPAGTELQELVVDGEVLGLVGSQNDERRLQVPLPLRKRFPIVRVSYSVQSPTLNIFAALKTPLAQVKCPVLQTEWQVLLPPGYALFSREAVGSNQPQRLSVGKRLFGPLYRKPGRGPFRLLAATDWQQMIGPVDDQLEMLQQANDCLRGLGKGFELARLQADGPQQVTWEAVLKNCLMANGSQLEPPGTVLWIDQESLLRHPLDTGMMASFSQADPLEIGRELLRSAKLSLMVSEDAIALTTVALDQEPADSNATGNAAVIHVVSADRLATEVRRESVGQETRWIDLQQWSQQFGDVTSPWLAASDFTSTQISDSRWSQHDFSLEQGVSSQIVVCRPLVLHSFAWAGLLVWAGLFTWLFASRPERLIQAVVLSGLVALLSPASIYPGPTCLFLGSLVAGLLIVTWRHSVARQLSAPRVSDLSFELQGVPKTLLSILMFVGLSTLALWSWADDMTDGEGETGKESAVGNQQVYRLLIPVDKESNPVGKYDYLPEEFFDELHRRTEKTSQSKAGWLLTDAEYRAAYDWSAVRNRLDNPAFAVTVKLEVLLAEQAIQIPVPRATVELSDVELNGQEVAINWSANGDAFILETDEPGSYTLTYQLRPNIRRIGGKSAIRFQIPRIPATRVVFPDSVDMPVISVLDRRGTVRRQLPSGDLVAELGACGQLGFAWAWQVPAPKLVPQTSVEQLTWMKVRPHSVVLETQFRFSVLRGKVSQVQLRVDPRLRMLPMRVAQPVRGTPRVQEGDVNRIHVDLREPTDRDFMLTMSFYMNQTSGVGQLQFPTLEAISDRVVARQVGVSVSNRLQWNAGEIDESQEVKVQQFAQRWGSEELPDFAFRPRAEDSQWSLATRRRIAESSATQQLDFEVGLDRLGMKCRMDIETKGSSVFQHRLHLPKGFHVNEVSLLKDGGSVPTRLAMSSDDRLTVFLEEGVTGQQQLWISGDWPHNGRSMRVPRLELETGTIVKRDVRIYRKSEMLVEVEGVSPKLLESIPGQGRFQDELGRLVISWTESSESEQRTGSEQILKLIRNQGKLRCRSVTRVFRRDDAWWAGMDCYVEVLTGVCDELQIEIPEGWGGDFNLTPAMPFEIKRLPGIPQPRLVIRPERALAKDFKIRIEGPLVLPPGGVRVPEITPLGMQRTTRYVVMPNRLGQQKLAWDTSGLQRIVSLPESIAVSLDTTDSSVARVLSEHFRARINEVQQVQMNPLIHLIDVYLDWSLNGKCFGVTTFDLQPAGRTECVLKVPEGYEMVDVRVAGLPGSLEELEEGRYLLQLGPSQLSQRIEVVFRGRLAIKTAVLKRVKTITPTIEEFPVSRTLWTVRSPRALGSGRPRNGEGATTIGKQAAQRLDTITAMVESANENRSDLTRQRIMEWLLAWDDRFQGVESAWNRTRVASKEATVEQSVAQALKRYQELKDRLDFAAGGPERGLEGLAVAGSADVWLTVVDGNQVVGDFEGQHAELDLVYPGIREGGDFGLRLLVSLGWLLVAGVGWNLGQRGVVGEWWVRWPYLFGVFLGLGWWLWLTPSLVGIVITFLSAIAAIIPSWLPLPTAEVSLDSKTMTDLHRIP